MVCGVFTAHAVVRPAAKGQEAALEFDVFLACLAETVWVEFLWPCEGLQGMISSSRSYTALLEGYTRTECLVRAMVTCTLTHVTSTTRARQPRKPTRTHLHRGCCEGGHEEGALWRREVLCQLKLPLCDLHMMERQAVTSIASVTFT